MINIIKKYLWVVHLVVIAICSYFAAQTVTTYLSMLLETEEGVTVPTGTGPAQAAQQPVQEAAAYTVIVERNIFHSAATPEDPIPELDETEERRDLDLEGTATKTTLNIKVLGTLVVDGGTDHRSSATVVGGKSRKAQVYFVRGKETFEEGAELIRVKRDRIEFSNRGRLEYALLEGVSEELTIFAKASQVHGNGKNGEKERPVSRRHPMEREEERPPSKEGDVKVIDQQEIDEALSNLDRLYTEVRIVPNFRDGKPAGLKVLAVKPGSLFSRLGLKRGDVLERINGLELDIRRGMELFGLLKDQKNLRIDLVRRGKSQTLEYEIR